MLNENTVKTFFNKPEYLLIETEETKSIVDSTGSVLLSGVYDEMTFFNDTLVKVKRDQKNGLQKLDSTYVLDLAYDAIDEEEGLVLSLKRGMIGCLDLNNGYVLSPSYESRIERIGTNYLARKEGKFGVIDTVETTILSFSYDEIKFWNDSSFLVRDGIDWKIINRGEETIDEPIQQLVEMVSIGDETIYKFIRDGKYGLLSNINGFILAPEFTDIMNIGDESEPIFFADQHLASARYHVVSYLNRLGELLFSKAYTTEEFEQILCDD